MNLRIFFPSPTTCFSMGMADFCFLQQGQYPVSMERFVTRWSRACISSKEGISSEYRSTTFFSCRVLLQSGHSVRGWVITSVISFASGVFLRKENGGRFSRGEGVVSDQEVPVPEPPIPEPPPGGFLFLRWCFQNTISSSSSIRSLKVSVCSWKSRIASF